MMTIYKCVGQSAPQLKVMFGWCNGWCDLLMVNGEKGSKEIQPSQDEHVTTGDQKSLGINENPNAFGSVAATNKNS